MLARWSIAGRRLGHRPLKSSRRFMSAMLGLDRPEIVTAHGQRHDDGSRRPWALRLLADAALRVIGRGPLARRLMVCLPEDGSDPAQVRSADLQQLHRRAVAAFQQLE